MSMVVVSVRVPKKLKVKAKKYGINISKVVRKALEEEIRKRELEELEMLLNSFRHGMKNIDKKAIVGVIREIREER